LLKKGRVLGLNEDRILILFLRKLICNPLLLSPAKGDRRWAEWTAERVKISFTVMALGPTPGEVNEWETVS
jgi:hypothetical protein